MVWSVRRDEIPNDHTVNYCSVSENDFKALDPTLIHIIGFLYYILYFVLGHLPCVDRNTLLYRNLLALECVLQYLWYTSFLIS